MGVAVYEGIVATAERELVLNRSKRMKGEMMKGKLEMFSCHSK